MRNTSTTDQKQTRRHSRGKRHSALNRQERTYGFWEGLEPETDARERLDLLRRLACDDTMDLMDSHPPTPLPLCESSCPEESWDCVSLSHALEESCCAFSVNLTASLARRKWPESMSLFASACARSLHSVAPRGW